MKMPRRTLLKTLILAAVAALSGVATPTPISAQDLEIAMNRDQMTEFALVHVAVNDARDEFHGAVARVHDPEGRLRAREEVEEAITAILEEAGMTREEFDQITLLISLDGELRAMFEEVMAELEGGTRG
ncbi:MAG TPA: hypothetical protein DCS75_00635 [Gemmatimonadetes bacterium]|nr:hypothetical protein [Gemmatimonadota bacterium]HBV05092.1 hypothetical protein [Gemmatimonadota bacterium]HCO13134.1 hypothetical protein [Gemmatimonadota bacterium]|tara:strand:- start:3257 stop:3643 length:387 start_codon:yes stop_codon:yes gene_type:complete